MGAIVRLEEKHDDLADQVKESRAEIASARRDNAATRTEMANTRLELSSTNARLSEVTGKLSVVPELISVLRESNQARNEIEHTRTTVTLDVDKAQQLSKIKIAEETALDPILARRERRKRITKWVGAIIGLPTAWEILKYIVGLLH